MNITGFSSILFIVLLHVNWYGHAFVGSTGMSVLASEMEKEWKSFIQNSDGINRVSLSRKPVGPLCGIYSLAAACKVSDIPVGLDQLLESKYVSGRKGSTVQDLCEAGTDFGFDTKPLKSLSVNSLKLSTNPMMLHLNRSQQQRMSRHWVLYLGDENGKAKLFDTQHGIELVNYSDVLAEWDGLAIEVSKSSSGNSHVFRRIVSHTWIVFAAVSLLIMKLIAAPFFLKTQKFLGLPSIAIVAVAVTCGFGYHWFSSTGFFGNPSSVALVTAYHHTKTLPTISCSDLAALVNNRSENCTIIDARPAGAYRYAHIPGAINAPIGLSPTQISEVVNSLEEKERVIVYCQAKGCRWDEMIAEHLVFAGVENVSIFEGGLNEWLETYEFERGQ